MIMQIFSVVITLHYIEIAGADKIADLISSLGWILVQTTNLHTINWYHKSVYTL